jgi:hypothetical protein
MKHTNAPITRAHQLNRAIALLEQARAAAARAETPGLLTKIRSALKSAGGAHRNMRCQHPDAAVSADTHEPSTSRH